MQVALILFIMLFVVCGMSMGLAWCLKLRSPVFLILAAGLGAGAAGGFLATAGSAMATSVNPDVALVQGAAKGFGAGLLFGCVCVGILKIFVRN